MSADPQPSGQDKMTASDTTLAGAHGSCPEPMEVQTADKTNADTMSSTNDIQAPEAMEVDPTDTIESGERGEDTDRKVEEVGAATTANIGAVGDKESAGNEAAELRKTDDKSDMDGVSHKDNVQLHADRQKELDHNKNTDGVSEKGRVQKNADEPRTTIDKGMADADVNDNVQQIADESRETNDKEMKDPSDKDNKQENTDESREPDNKNKDGASDEDNVQQNTDESRESENKDKDGAADKDNIQQNTDESRESENKDKDVAADRDNIQQNTDESRKTADIDMDDVSDKDNVQQTADDSGEPVDKDKDGAGDTERRDADDSGKTNETPDNKTPGEGHTNKYDIPDTLEGFGYIFNDEGKLRHKETGQPFEFQVYPDHSANQKRYEAIGEVITEYVYELLETKAHLKRIWLPTDASEEEAKSFFFATDDALTNDKLLILIHGSGVVRAGQWARRLIINDNLACGTQLPFILRAVEEGYGVMVLNTNLNRVTLDGRYVYIRENSTPDRHGLYVWENFVEKAKAAHIAIVAHSYGGVVTTNLLKARTDDFQKRVFAVAFTDSVHSVPHQHICQRFYQKNARNWISSNYPLDKEVEDYGYDAPLVSAGHPKHEWTSWSSLKSIFKFFTEKYTERTGELRHEQEED